MLNCIHGVDLIRGMHGKKCGRKKNDIIEQNLELYFIQDVIKDFEKSALQFKEK